MQIINIKNLGDAIIGRDMTRRRLERSLRPFCVFGIPVPSDVLMYSINELGHERVSEILSEVAIGMVHSCTE